jgi:hypothetical protein
LDSHDSEHAVLVVVLAPTHSLKLRKTKAKSIVSANVFTRLNERIELKIIGLNLWITFPLGYQVWHGTKSGPNYRIAIALEPGRC